MRYCQLNTITCFEFGKSTIELDKYAIRAKELDYQAIAVADTNLYSFPYLAHEAERQKIKPIYGYRFTLSCQSPRNLSAVLYVKNEQGYLNLCQLISNRDSNPSRDVLDALKEGLILVIDCSDNDFFDEVFLTALSPSLLFYKKVFKDDFYMGISISSVEDKEDVGILYEFCDRNEYQTLAFPKARYIKKSDAEKTELLEKSLEKEIVYSLPSAGPDFLLSTKVLDSIYREKDIRATVKVADKCEFTFFTKRGKLLTFNNDDQTLSNLARRRLEEKIPHASDIYLARLTYELDVIKDMHFSSYFLLVADYVRFARHKGIKIGPGRGSAAGSLVSFALGITELDPIRFNLSFERFLNPKRSSMPDIDIDFEDDRRNEVVEYLMGKYGPERVSPIITFSKLKPKSALNLIGRSLSFNRLKDLTVCISDKANNFKEAKEDYRYGKKLKGYLRDPYYASICQKADGLLGLPINTSQHAAGIIISEEPIAKTCPMDEGEHGVVEFEYPTMEKLGFLKFDILALSNLTLIKLIEDKIKRNNKEIPDIINNLDDKETYDTLNKLHLADIFQLESEGMIKTTNKVKPTCFSDLAAVIALFRPGPMDYIDLFADRKHGKQEIEYDSELLRPVLEDTYGVMVYQEQVIEAVQKVADFSASNADLFRRAISKKNLKIMEDYKTKFMISASKKVGEETAKKIYQSIEQFADYGFNKSHAYSYALITYQLLYYKTHYREEFYSTCIERTGFNTMTMKKLKEELESLNYFICTPDINASDINYCIFSPDRKVYLQLSSVSSYDDEFLHKISEERKWRGAFKSFYDFCYRLNSSLNKNAVNFLKSLISGGAFDKLCPSRKGMIDKLDYYIQFARMGFEESKLPSLVVNEDLGERLYLEKNSLGAIFSTKLSDIVSKDGFTTTLVTDDSRYELDHLLDVTDGHRDYKVETDGKMKINKNEFLLIDADFKFKRIYPRQIINAGRKIINYE